MRILNLIFLIFLVTTVFSQNAPTQDSIVAKESLVGKWILDLRPSPDADPYFQSLLINQQREDKFTGLFYGSAIQEVYLNKNWDKLYFAFKTSDNSNEYYQSGYIVGEEIFGVTFCPGRDFVLPWSGRKVQNE